MRKRIILITIISFLIVLQGFLIISNRMDQFIKDKSDFSLTYKISPLELKIDTKKYIMDISQKSFDEFVNKISEVIYDTFNGNVK